MELILTETIKKEETEVLHNKEINYDITYYTFNDEYVAIVYEDYIFVEHKEDKKISLDHRTKNEIKKIVKGLL